MIGDTSRMPRPLQGEWGQFLNRTKWQWYGTLTFDDYVSPWEARKGLRCWARWIARTHINQHLRIAFAMEKTGKQVWHFHVLIDAPPHLFRPNVADAKWKTCSWAGGFTKLEPFDPDGNAAFYLAKTKSVDVGVVCPRTRKCVRSRSGCLVGPYPF